MNLQAAFLSDAAVANADGTFMVWRGGITDTWVMGQFPTLIKFSLVVRLQVEPSEVNELHAFSVQVFHRGGAVAPAQSLPVAMRAIPGETRYFLNVATDLIFPVTDEGEGYVEAMVDEDLRLPHLHFHVRKGPPQPPALQSPPPSG